MPQVSSPAQRRHRILVVDDHPVVRRGLRAILEQENDLEVCGDVGTAADALDAYRDKKPDLITLDIALDGSDGLDVIKTIRAEDELVPILVISMYDEASFAERVLRSGGNGYLMKEELDLQIIAAVRRILGGGIYLSERVSQSLLRTVTGKTAEQHRRPEDSLSDREIEVYRLLGEGTSSRQIAEHLGISVKTVETYRAHIKDKLGLENATQLVRAAVRWVEAMKRG